MNAVRWLLHKQYDTFALQAFLHKMTSIATFIERRQAPFVTVELALERAQQPVHVQPSCRASRLSCVRIFARHRKAADPRTEIPSPAPLPFQPKRARPRPCSDEEIRKLLPTALDMPHSFER